MIDQLSQQDANNNQHSAPMPEASIQQLDKGKKKLEKKP